MNAFFCKNSSWAAGNCRVWRRECFDEAGYVVEVSADAVSAARAVMRSWQVGSTDTAKVYTREMKGGGEGWKYYGKSMYVRNIPTYYMFAFVLRQFVNFRHKEAIGLFLGYMDAKKRSVPKISDELAKKYFKNILYYRIKNIFNK